MLFASCLCSRCFALRLYMRFMRLICCLWLAFWLQKKDDVIKELNELQVGNGIIVIVDSSEGHPSFISPAPSEGMPGW